MTRCVQSTEKSVAQGMTLTETKYAQNSWTKFQLSFWRLGTFLEILYLFYDWNQLIDLSPGFWKTSRGVPIGKNWTHRRWQRHLSRPLWTLEFLRVNTSVEQWRSHLPSFRYILTWTHDLESCRRPFGFSTLFEIFSFLVLRSSFFG